jgi:hypothetical protein
MNLQNNINEVFKIPICYNENVQKLDNSVISELELVQSIDIDETPIYDNIFKPSNKASEIVIKQVANYYTTDAEYLKETQELTNEINLEEINTIYNKNSFSDDEINNVVSSWEEIKGETGFCEKYLYIDWSFAKHLNNNQYFLQLMSVYNITSPLLSLSLPIFVLIIPFFIIKLKGAKIGIKEYIDILKVLISNNAIFKIFTQFHEVDNGQKIYLIISTVFYLFSIYQNILICVRFYSNMQKIHNYIFKFKQYLEYTLDIIKYHRLKSDKLTKYAKFNSELDKNTLVLTSLHNELNKISSFKLSFSKISEIGHIMFCFYQLYVQARCVCGHHQHHVLSQCQ